MTYVSVNVTIICRAMEVSIDGAGRLNRAYPYTGQKVCAAIVMDDEKRWPDLLTRLADLDSEGRRVAELLRLSDEHMVVGDEVVHYFPGVRLVGPPCKYDEESA